MEKTHWLSKICTWIVYLARLYYALPVGLTGVGSGELLGGTQKENLAAVANAIRAKEGSSQPIKASGFPERIRALQPQRSYVAGRDWWETTLPASRNWSGIAYGNGVFIAIAYAGNMCGYSTDGVNWSENTLPSSDNRMGIVYGGGKFVCSIYGSRGANSSADGITWDASNTVTNATAQRCIAYGNGRFVILSSNGSTSNQKVSYSTTGTSWSDGTAPAKSGTFNAVAYGNGRFVTSYQGDVYYSTTGSGWSATKFPSSRTCYSIVYGGDKFVAALYGANAAYYSYDGITWEETTLPATGYWYGVTYGNGRFVMVAANNTNKVVYSDDGITWEESELPFAGNWRAVTYGDGKFVAVASGSDKFAYSCAAGPAV